MVFLTLTLPQAITVQSTSHIKARSDQLNCYDAQYIHAV